MRRAEVETWLFQVMRDEFEIKATDRDDDLEAAGFYPADWVDLIKIVRRDHGRELNRSLLEDCETFDDLITTLHEVLG